MRQWVRRPIPVKCGRCGVRVVAGSPVQLIDPDTSRSVKHRFIRCEACADEKAPPDVPTLEPRRLDSMTRLHLAELFDFKAAQMAKERE